MYNGKVMNRRLPVQTNKNAVDRRKTVAVVLWNKKKTPVCPSFSRSRRQITLPMTSPDYAWCPDQPFANA